MREPLVSVVLPAFNAERWIAASMHSVLTQTWPNLEVIVVDDGSSDRTAEIVARVSDSRVKVISQPNRGASAARNTALREVQGEYVQFFDADDLLDREKIAIQVAALQHADSGRVASCAWTRFVDDPTQAAFRPMNGWEDLTAYQFLYDSAMERGTFPPIAWLVPRHLCEAAGPWDERLSVNDDGEYFARLLAASSGIIFCERARVYYRSSNPASYSNRFSLAAAHSELRAWESIGRTILALENSERSRRAVATGYQRLQVRYYPHFPEIVAEARRREREFGRGAYRFEGGVPYHIARIALGWRVAARLRLLKSRLLRRR